MRMVRCCPVGLLLALLGLVPAEAARPSVLAEVLAHGCRDMWIPLGDGSAIHRLADHGFNAATAATWLLTGADSSMKPNDPAILAEADVPAAKLALIRQQARAAAERGVLYMPYINQMADEEVRLLAGKEYRRTVNHLGVRMSISPCPLERKDWLGFQLPQMLAIARVLAEEGCTGGIMLECEAYRADIYPGYHSQRQDFCYCDHCFGAFVAKLPPASRPTVALAPADRYPWLSARGLLWAYEGHMRTELSSLLRELAAEVRRVYPQCLFGLYPCAVHWYSDGIIAGLGTRRLPVLVYSASEYFSGYNTTPGWTWSSNYSSADHAKHLKRLGAPHVYLGGLSVGTYWPERMGMEMLRLAREVDGSWLYWGGTLLAADGSVGVVPEGGSEYVLRDRPSVFWPFLQRANEAIAARSAPAGGALRPIGLAWRETRAHVAAGQARAWDAQHPPSPATGWDAAGLMPRVDPQRQALVFDLNSDTRAPKANALDYAFQQAAGADWLFGVEVCFEGGAEGARVNLGYSYPGYVEGDGRRIWCLTNRVVWPEEGWRTLWLHIPAPAEHREAWVRLHVLPNSGKVWVRRLILSPAALRNYESQPLSLAVGEDWDRLEWFAPGPEAGVVAVTLQDSVSGRDLLGGLRPGERLDDVSRVYGISVIRVQAQWIAPGQTAPAASAPLPHAVSVRGR